MAYATTTEVQSEFKSIDFSTSNTVTTAEVSDFIDQADAYIDSRIGSRYSTPVTGGASALLLLKRITICMVKDRIVKVLQVKTGSGDTDQDSRQRRITDLENCMAVLDEIAGGKAVLGGATTASSPVTDYNSNNNITQTFSAEDDQW